jgi:DNA polymerase-3 subunit delta
MPAASKSAPPAAPLLLVCGEDEFAVKQRGREVFQTWSAEIGGMDHEIIDASVSNSGEALKCLGRLRESLQTLPFFGTGKVIWLQNCNFLGDERSASAQAVTETLAELAEELKKFSWGSVRLLISAGKVDKRKIFYKTLDKLGTVETLAGWSADDRDWADQAELWGRSKLRGLKKEISDEALGQLISCVGPNARLLDSEIEKLALYVGDRARVGIDDVDAIVTRNKQARAFAVGDALGDRELPRLLRCLDQELWSMKFDREKSEIRLLYGFISKMRSLIFLKEMIEEGWVKPTSDYNRFKTQLGGVPAEALPADKRFNPLAINPYMLFKALPQAARYSRAELVRAMARLLECNRQLVQSGLDESLVLQQALVDIVGTTAATPR